MSTVAHVQTTADVEGAPLRRRIPRGRARKALRAHAALLIGRSEHRARIACEAGVAVGVKTLNGLDARFPSTMFTVTPDTDAEDAASSNGQGSL